MKKSIIMKIQIEGEERKELYHFIIMMLHEINIITIDECRIILK